jgi:hypothetical protein
MAMKQAKLATVLAKRMASANFLMVAPVLLFLGWVTFDMRAGEGWVEVIDSRPDPNWDEPQFKFSYSASKAVIENLVPAAMIAGGLVCIGFFIDRAMSGLSLRVKGGGMSGPEVHATASTPAEFESPKPSSAPPC